MTGIQKRLSSVFYLILGLPSTAMGFALSIQIAVLSWILRTRYHLEIDQIGFVWAAGPVAGILGQPLIGLISDNVWFWGGRRRPFIIIGGILAALMILALPFIDRINDFFGIGSLLAVAVTVALTLDLSINISFNPTRSIIADVTPEGPARTKGYTWMQSVSNLFGSMAYLIGAILGNYILIFLGAAIVFLFSIIPLFFIEEPRELSLPKSPEPRTQYPEPSTQHPEPSTHSPIPSTRWPELIKLYFAHAFSWLGIQTMFVYMFAFLEQKIPAPPADTDRNAVLGQMIGWSFFILNAVGSIWPAFLLEPLSRKIGRVRTHILSLLSMSAGYFGIVYLVHDQFALYCMMGILTLGWAAVVSLPFAVMSEIVDKKRMGYFMGLFNLSVVLPQLVSSLVLGNAIAHAGNKNIIFLISGLSLLLSAVLWIFVSDRKPDHHKAGSGN